MWTDAFDDSHRSAPKPCAGERGHSSLTPEDDEVLIGQILAGDDAQTGGLRVLLDARTVDARALRWCRPRPASTRSVINHADAPARLQRVREIPQKPHAVGDLDFGIDV